MNVFKRSLTEEIGLSNQSFFLSLTKIKYVVVCVVTTSINIVMPEV